MLLKNCYVDMIVSLTLEKDGKEYLLIAFSKAIVTFLNEDIFSYKDNTEPLETKLLLLEGPCKFDHVGKSHHEVTSSMRPYSNASLTFLTRTRPSGMVHVDETLYVLGGRSRTIECYDHERDEWKSEQEEEEEEKQQEKEQEEDNTLKKILRACSQESPVKFCDFLDESFPQRRFIIPPAGFTDEQPLQQGPFLFGRPDMAFPGFNFSGVEPQFPVNFPFNAQGEASVHSAFRRNTPVEQARVQAREQPHQPKKSSQKSESTRNRWTEGEVKLLISIYGEEYGKRDKGRSLELMWERIAARLVTESKELNDHVCDKTAKNCRDKMNNLNKKYKAVKDKSKQTGEGSEGIKSFPEFNDLDEIWGTRDSVNPKYVIEAGTSSTSSAATPVPSPSFSLADESAVNTSNSSIDESEQEIAEEAPLAQALGKKATESLKKKKAKRALEDADEADDDLTNEDESLAQSERLFFKAKNQSKKGKSKAIKKKKKESSDIQSKEDELLSELIKSQVEAANRAEEEKKELFGYLRESDNRTQELVLGAIRELGAILKK
ncbi:hypothetical protein ACROYT_G013231 [Oculina patagonica]